MNIDSIDTAVLHRTHSRNCPSPFLLTPPPQAVTSYFAQANPSALPYGFVPEIASLKTAAVSLGTGATMVVPATTPAKAVAASAPKDPADFSSPAGATSTYAGGGGEGGAGSRDEGVPEPAAADGATEKAAPTGKPLSVAGVESEEDLESFLTAVGSGTLVLLDFGAEWCKNCKAMLVSECASTKVVVGCLARASAVCALFVFFCSTVAWCFLRVRFEVLCPSLPPLLC